MKFILVFAGAALLMLQACATTGPGTPDTAPVNNDPLIGQIIDSQNKSNLSFDTLVERLLAHDVIYLSEKHDNPVHHAAQHRIIQALINQGQNPVIGFEFFAMDDTSLLLSLVDSRQAGHDRETETALEKKMRNKLGWADQTDTMWKYYWDLLRLARDNGLWAAGLDLDDSLKRRITRKGHHGLTSLEQSQLFSTHLSDPVYETYMKKIFKQVHCGMGNDRMLSRLYDTWLARNDKMAQSITQLFQAAGKSSPPKGPLVIIMGNGHTEYKLGVMDRVQAIFPGASQVNLSLSEVFAEPQPLGTYLAPLDLAGYPKSMPADYIWFTGRVSNQDPCDKFRHVIERMKKKKKQE
jgi:uncharacterized iron-regulated protein